MFIFRKARSPTQTLNDLDEYLRTLSDEPVKWLAREVQSWGNEFSYDELAAVIQSGQLDALIDWQGRYASVVNDTLTPIWLAAIAAASAKATRGKTVLSDSDWYVQSWIQSRGGELISQLSEESRRAVMSIILRGQELHMAPRDVAKGVRPLIGLTERQVQANANYRDKVYQQYIDGGATPSTAAARADKAAIKYAGKQHRYRAETIVLTENAFAYNRGAHMGVSQSIANGYMGRCEMVWTTAGTNRVCSRCLALKDTVVGHTDESGVTLPPLHPRCRCAIMYREVGTPRVMQPKPALNAEAKKAQTEFITRREELSQKVADAKDLLKNAKGASAKQDAQFKLYEASANLSAHEGRQKLPDTLANVKRGEAMSVDDANKGKPNINYGKRGYDINCQTCVVAYEARLRGYNVKARANIKNSVSDWLSLQNTNYAWVDINKGVAPDLLFDTEIGSLKQLQEWLEASVEQNARYTLEYYWGRGSRTYGHILTIGRTTEGALQIYDPQIGAYYAGEKLVEHLKNFKLPKKAKHFAPKLIAPKLLRIDNKAFNVSVVDEILEAF